MRLLDKRCNDNISIQLHMAGKGVVQYMQNQNATYQSHYAQNGRQRR